MPVKRNSKVRMAAKGVAALATAAKTALNARSGARGGARTASILKRKTKFSMIKKGGSTTSFFTHKNTLPKYMGQVFKQNEEKTFITNTSNRLYTAAGKQLYAAYHTLVAGAVNGTSDIAEMLKMANNNTALSGDALTTSLYLGVSKTNHMFTNNQTNNVFVDMYDIVARRDHSQPAQFCAHNGLIDQGVSSGMEAINVTPFMSKAFTTHWKVVKKTSIELGPGESHRHVFTFHANARISAERLDSSQAFWGGIGHGTLYIAWGAPNHDATTVANVNTGSVLLDLVASRQQSYTFCTNAVTSTKYTTSLPTLVTERGVNEESGTPATVSS